MLNAYDPGGVTSQTLVVRPMTPIIIIVLYLIVSLLSLSFLTLWSSRLTLTCSRLLDSLYIGRVAQIKPTSLSRVSRVGVTVIIYHVGVTYL